MTKEGSRMVVADGSRFIIEGLASAGAEVYVGYPITPANWLYAYASQRFPTFLAAPDEISALQWAAGFSATGKLPVTGTSFPGFALMTETLNMAYMMELPMVIVLAQRMGPSTGSATTGAQGDLLLLRGIISGGYPLPVFSPSNLKDCWELAAGSVRTALQLRTPVVLLTSKEMIMTQHSFDLSELSNISPVPWASYHENGEYQPYRANEHLIPPFLPVGNSRHQVRLNASTHDVSGLIRKATPGALANTRRLRDKLEQRIAEFSFFEYDRQEGADQLIVTYGITAEAARDALAKLRKVGQTISLLVMKTLLPVPPGVTKIIDAYRHVIIAEENLNGLLAEMLFGIQGDRRLHKVNKIGSPITPSEIVKEVEQCQKAS